MGVLINSAWAAGAIDCLNDPKRWNILGDAPVAAHASNFALIAPMSRGIARWNFYGKLKTAVEEPGQAQQELDSGWQATISFGFPQYDGRRPPGTKGCARRGHW
jgi:hypothetical protein